MVAFKSRAFYFVKPVRKIFIFTNRWIAQHFFFPVFLLLIHDYTIKKLSFTALLSSLLG